MQSGCSLHVSASWAILVLIWYKYGKTSLHNCHVLIRCLLVRLASPGRDASNSSPNVTWPGSSNHPIGYSRWNRPSLCPSFIDNHTVLKYWYNSETGHKLFIWLFWRISDLSFPLFLFPGKGDIRGRGDITSWGWFWRQPNFANR